MMISQDSMDDPETPPPNTVYIRVSLPDQKTQRCLQFQLDETVWAAKQIALATLAKEVRDGINYGFYCPPMNGRAGKFLEEERKLREYPLAGPIGFLEFKYKRRVYRLMQVNPRKLKQLHTKANLKQFLDYVRKGDVEKVNKFLIKGLDPNFHNNDVGETPLTMSTTLTSPRPMIMTLVNGGAHLDFRRKKDGCTPMHKAAICGNYEALKILLELGASPNYRDARGLTPLYYGVFNDTSPYCLELLLHDHSVIGLKDEQGWTEVHQACRFGRVQHLEHLIFYGADMDVQNTSGNTPLHVCAVNNQESCARVLLFRGAKKNIENNNNQTPCQVAAVAGNFDLAEIIQRHKHEDVVPFKESPIYNERRRSIAPPPSLSNLLRSRSDPRLDLLYSNEKPPSPANSIYSLPQFNHSDDSGRSPSFIMDDSDSSSRSLSICSTSSVSRRSSIETASLYSYSKKRLYAALPGRTFICVKSYHAQEEGELNLKKGDFVEVLSVGEKGFWEGKTGDREGWFPSLCVQEVKMREQDRRNIETGSVLIRRNTLAALMLEDNQGPRTVVLVKGKKGFGFVLRGAKSGGHAAVNINDFKPTAFQPALQYFDKVDKGGVADKAGLKQGDFILEINGENVVSATHEHAVKLIKNSGSTIAMKVLTVLPEDQECDTINLTMPTARGRAPLPPRRNPDTQLSLGRSRSKSVTEGLETLRTLEDLDRTLALYDSSTDLSNSIEDLTTTNKEKIASVRGRPSSQRINPAELEHLFKSSEPPTHIDTEKSASNIEKPTINPVPRTYANPAELKAQARRRKMMKQEQAELQRAKSSPNLSQSGDSGIESSSGSSAGDVTVIIPAYSQDSGNQEYVSEYAQPNVSPYSDTDSQPSLGAAYAATDIHPVKEYVHEKSNSLFDLRQYARGYVGPVPSQERKAPTEPRTYSAHIPPAPDYAAPPPPPARKPVTEIVKIQTAKDADAIYMNVEELRKDGYSVPSSFKPANNAKYNTAPAYKPNKRPTVSENIYASPQLVKRDQTRALPAEVTYAEVHTEGTSRKQIIVPPPPTEPAPLPGRQGVTFADVKIYDNAAKYIQNNPNAIILLTDEANSVSSGDQRRMKLCKDSSAESDGQLRRSGSNSSLPYYLPDPDYEVDSCDDTIQSPPKSMTSPSKRSSSVPPIPPPPMFDAPKPQSVRKPLTLEEQLRMSGRRRMLRTQGRGRSLGQGPVVAAHEVQKPVETTKVQQTQVKPEPQVDELKAAVAMRQARVAYRTESKTADNNVGAVVMRQARTSYRTEVKTPDSGMEVEILKNNINNGNQQEVVKPNIPAPPPIKEPNIPKPPQFVPTAVKLKPRSDSAKPPKPPPTPNKPTENDLLSAIAQRKAKMSGTKENPLENIEKKIAENKQMTPKMSGHDDHLRLAVLRRREKLSKKSGEAVVEDIEKKIRDSRISRISVDMSGSVNAQKEQLTVIPNVPDSPTVSTVEPSMLDSPVVIAPPNSPIKAVKSRVEPSVPQSKESVVQAGKTDTVRTKEEQRSSNDLGSAKPISGVDQGPKDIVQMVPVKPARSDSGSSRDSVSIGAGKGVEKARRGIPQKSDMLGVNVTEDLSQRGSENNPVMDSESSKSSAQKPESFTARAERLRREWLQKRNSSSSLDVSGSDDDTAQKTGASIDPVKEGLNKDMLDLVKGRTPPVQTSLPIKTKRFVLKVDSRGKGQYVQEEKQDAVSQGAESDSGADSDTLKKNDKNLRRSPVTNDDVILPPPDSYSLGEFVPVPPPSNFSSSTEDVSDLGFIPPPPEYNFDLCDSSSLVSSVSTLSTTSSSGPHPDALLSFLSTDRVRMENDYVRNPEDQWRRMQSEIKPVNKYQPVEKYQPDNSSDIYEELYAPPPPGFIDDGPIYEEVGEVAIPPPAEFISTVKPQTITEIQQNKINSALESDKKGALPLIFRDKSIQDWTTDDVSAWLDSLSLSDYKSSFCQHEIDGTCLVHMGRSDFMDIGVTRVGHRLTMERSIKKIQLQQETVQQTQQATPQIIASF